MLIRLSLIILISTLFILGVLVSIFLGIDISHSKEIVFFCIISFAGGFGGLLYTLRDNGLEIPHIDPGNKNVLNLGWLADCAYGVAGSLVIFIIVPADLNEGNNNPMTILKAIKLLALALVGGYGGRSLVDRALSNIAREAEEAKQNAVEANRKVNQIQDLDTKALELVNRHLDENHEPLNISKLKDSIKDASQIARFEIFKEAKEVRSTNWNKNVSFMERTIPIFEALIENTAGEEFHRNHGQLGYALKDRGEKDDSIDDWERAYEELSRAINLRDKNSISGFLMYEFNRALCGIKLGKELEAIKQDISLASTRPSLKSIIKNSEVFKAWAELNNYEI